MPWRKTSVMEERYRFVIEAETYLGTFTELCRHYGISAKTGYKWLERHRIGGVESLKDESRAPRVQAKQLDRETERAIVRLRQQHPTWGPKKLRILLSNEGRTAAQSTIGEILKRNGLSVPRRRRRRATPTEQPFAECDSANQVWCADFKGWFRTGDGSRCDPLTITDGYSRYFLRCHCVQDMTYRWARGVFEAAFREYGLPLAIRTDNGSPFASRGLEGLTRLSVWWLKLGIEPERIEPGKPEQNGRHERMHLTLKKETATPPAETIRGQQKRFDEFRKEYNQERPHEGLGMRTPASLYEASSRIYPARLIDPEYGREYVIRRVGGRGEFRWEGSKIYLCRALVGELIGIRAETDRIWKIYFGKEELATFDAHTQRVLTHQEATRLQRKEGQ
jgi:putative transposase